MADCFKRRLALGILAALLVMVAVPSWASQILIYAQNPDFNGLYASQNDTTGGFGAYATSYDDFSLSRATALTSVEWIGGYFDPASAGTITAWTVSFYADASGQPGTLLSSVAVSGNAGEFSLGTDNAGNPVYLYGVPVNFVANASTTYWLSVVPDVGFPPQWGWTTSSQGDGVAWQNFFGTGSQIPSDLSFALYTTPEPGSLMLLASGIIGAAGVLRRKL